MGWLIACILALLFTQHWFLAFLLLIYIATRPRATLSDEKWSAATAQECPPSSQFSASTSPVQETSALLVLRLELERRLAAGEIDRASYDRAIHGIDTSAMAVLAHLDIVPHSAQWRQGRAAGWELLARRRLIPPGPPPWHDEEDAAVARASDAQPESSLPPEPPRTPETTEKRTAPLSAPVPPARQQTVVSVPPLAPASLALLKQPAAVPLRESALQPAQTTPAPSAH